MKIYRPKTCGVVPKPLDRQRYAAQQQQQQQQRPHTCQYNTGNKAKLGAMDLAIQWEYRPIDLRDEPVRAAHIDGTDASPGPAIFTVVKTPRTPLVPPMHEVGRSGGIFANTTGENDFFDKDIVRSAAPFGRPAVTADKSCRCDEQAQQADRYKRKHYTAEALARLNASDDITRPHQHRSRANEKSQLQLNGGGNGSGGGGGGTSADSRRRCKSSPNLSQVVNVGSMLCEGVKPGHHHHHLHSHNKAHKTIRLCDEYAQQHNGGNGSAQQRRSPSSVAPDDNKKPPFKMGIPNSNASGTCISFDSGCGGSVGAPSSASSSSAGCSSKTSVRVPKPRHPYAKRDYAIETLSPPFACWHGGAGQGGYPEHWRLASVYQHAYKPIEQRLRPLLATVYQ